MAFEKENREAERFPVNANSGCVFMSPVLEDVAPVKIKNVSMKGIGLICTERLDVGVMIVVKLANPLKNFTKTTLARVVQVTPQPGNSYLVGAVLDAPLTYEELCILVM